MKLTLIDRIELTSDVVSFVFRPEKSFSWIAGQFLTYTLDHPNPDKEGTSRYFTISSAPYEGQVVITTRITNSTFKQALNVLPIGGEIEASPPDGDFFVRQPKGKYVFIAGGIGITPFHSIIKQLAHEEKTIDLLLLYANRTKEEIVFKAELDGLSSTMGFDIIYIVEPEKIDQETIRRYVPDLAEPTFYISGPEPMVEALDKLVKDLGVSDERRKQDFFPNYTGINY
jgi:ferredoxin-NADP reductase